MPIFIKEIKPSRLKVDAMRLVLFNAMRVAGTQIKKDFENTTKTWKNKPKFEVLISLTGPGPVLYIDTDDEIYRYINEGTAVRRAIMSGDWQSKSHPMVLGSFPGRGEVVFIGRNVSRPGIKARKFDEAIKNKREKWFKKQMEAAMKSAARASGHAIG